MKLKQLKHKQVELELRQLAATLPADAKLPAERDLAIEYKCNFLTVRRALKQLVDDGLIVRRIGSGTFVAQKNPHPINGSGEKRIGVLVYEKGNAYAFAVLQAIAHAALEDSVELRSCWVRDFADDGLRQAEVLVREGCAALTLPWFPHEMTEEVRGFVRSCPVPTSLPMAIPGLETFCFEEKHLFGATLLMAAEGLCRYFARLGQERIAYLGPDAPSDVILQQELGAYSCFASRENRETLCGLVPAGSRHMDQLALRWKSFRGDLAIVSYDDEHALRFMTAMHKIGMSAPQDFRIVGYNNTDASHYSDPPLSTVGQNFDHIGHWLLKSALALSEGKICQSNEAPSLEFLVRHTCGGRDRIDGPLRETLRNLKLDVCVEDSGANGPAEIAPVANQNPPDLAVR